MNNLSCTEKFFMLAINNKGKMSALKEIEIHACLIAGSILELTNSGTIARNEKGKLIATKELDDKHLHLSPLYERIAFSKKPKSMESLAGDYMSGSKCIEQLITGFRNSLISKNYKDELNNKGLFKNKTIYVPKSEAVQEITLKISEQFFGTDSLTDETICLASLMDASRLTHDHFSRIDAKKLRKKLKELPKSGAYGLAKKMIDETIAMMAIMTTILMD